MKSKKDIFYLFLGIISLLIIYNFIMPFYSAQNFGGMRMGMHGRERYVNNNILIYNNIFIFIIILSILSIVFVIGKKVLYHSSNGKCNRCGFQIENNNWKLCPHCGFRFENKGGNHL
jgi:ribosomal protein L37E